MKRKMYCVFWVSLIFLFSPVAWADVVPNEPASCPKGSRPSTSHAGAYCALELCTSDADCSGGATCQDVSVCVEEKSGDSNGGPFTIENLVGACGANNTCQTGSCLSRKLCSNNTPTAGCSSLPFEGGSFALMLALLMLLLGTTKLYLRRQA